MPGKNYGATSFGERLQAIHRARGLTQVQLADAAETNQRAVSLAKAPKVTTEELLGVKPTRVVRIHDDG